MRSAPRLEAASSKTRARDVPITLSLSACKAKGRARDGTGTAATVTARARLHTSLGIARTGTHGAGVGLCLQLPPRAGHTSTLRSDTSGVLFDDAESRVCQCRHGAPSPSERSPGVSPYRPPPLTTADAHHATGQAGAHPLPTVHQPSFGGALGTGTRPEKPN